MTFFIFISLPWISKIKTNKQKSKIHINFWKSIHWISFLSLLHMAKNTEQRQSPGGWWLCLVLIASLDRRIQSFTNAAPLSKPPSIIYSSLVRRLPKTYSTKCPKTTPVANNCVEIFNQAWLLSTTLYTMYTAPPNPRSVSWDRRSGEGLEFLLNKKR